MQRLILLLLLLLPFHSLSSPFNFSIHIDCGAPTNSTDAFGVHWLSDRYYAGGAAAVVSEPLRFSNQQEKTLRYFPSTAGKKNCYSVPAGGGGGRFLLRTFTVYDNFDGKGHPPSFEVSVSGTVVFSWRSPWQESISRTGAYADLFLAVPDPVVDVCFYSIATDSPVIAALELFQTSPDAYGSSNGSVLINYGRFSAWPGQWDPGFSNDTDPFGRSWQPEALYRSRDSFIGPGATIKDLTTSKIVANASRSPNYFPMKLYQSAVTLISEGDVGGNGYLSYNLPVDAKMDYLLLLHFAEIDGNVSKAGQRVFDVVVNEVNVSRVDVYKEAGAFTAYEISYVVKNLTSTWLNVRLQPVVGAPIICGLENYAIVPADFRTLPDQVIAMKALKESLRVPDRMGWNGDPCAPTTWDAWEGVTCLLDKNQSALVISQIDLGRQGLKGYITDKINLLTNLVSMNLSSNSLGGTLPSGLGQKSLVKLDLSSNMFTGSIPDSLTSSSLQLVLLKNNLLEGRVPEELYSVGVRGGTIDLSGNKGLCGVPSLPDCSIFWEKNGLSTGGKVAVGLSCVVAFCLVLLAVYIYIKRKENDYDFGLPQELTALAAKRNRYQRHKTLMTLEMESQHAKGFIPNYTGK